MPKRHKFISHVLAINRFGMGDKMNKYIATFFSHFGAMRFMRELKEAGIEGTIMPVPRSLSSSCGTCVAYSCPDEAARDKVLFWTGGSFADEIEQIVKVAASGYEQVYRAEEE